MAINVKLLLANALIELCNEKPLSKISVTEITKRAGTGRQTFYNHFVDKCELIYWIFTRTLKGEKELVESSGLYAYLSNLYEEAKKYKVFLYQACMQEGQNSLSEAIFNQTYEYYKKYIIRLHGENVLNEELEYAMKFNAYGASHLYIEWVKDGMKGPAKLQALFAINCMPPQMRKYLPFD